MKLRMRMLITWQIAPFARLAKPLYSGDHQRVKAQNFASLDASFVFKRPPILSPENFQ
jgi:hypothetical protein